MAGVAAEYTDLPVLLGERRSMVGVITRPRAAGDPGLPAVVILNTGIVHRVGHHRMYVTLSRLLAAAGRTVVRFDQSSLGDSSPRNDQLPPLAAGLADIKDALDWIEKTHRLSRFVLIGLCSGADQSILYGHSDARVLGMVIMDPTLPPTPRYYFYYIVKRLSNLQNWISVLTLRSGLMRIAVAHLRNRFKPRERSRPPTLLNLQFSPYLAQCYGATAARGLKVLAAFTSLSPRHAYERQILDAFPELSTSGTLQLQYFRDSDHLFSAPRDRERLYRVIASWLDVHWGG
jgi:pimeloyl-ACP methyl ester carboxylesterase